MRQHSTVTAANDAVARNRAAYQRSITRHRINVALTALTLVFSLITLFYATAYVMVLLDQLDTASSSAAVGEQEIPLNP